MATSTTDGSSLALFLKGAHGRLAIYVPEEEDAASTADLCRGYKRVRKRSRGTVAQI
jgi:hypothetical protein